MVTLTEGSIKSETISDKEDLDYKIKTAVQTLDRNIGFVTNCDNKTSIVLASFGVLFAIILSNAGLNEILSILKTCIAMKTFCSMAYLLCFLIVTFVMMFGMLNLGSVLVAKTSEKSIGRKDEKSRIFFVGIRKYGDYKTYNQEFLAMDKEDLLNDLIEQIYINADIASIKYASYNRGLKSTAIGFFLFIILLIIGICNY